MNFDERSKQLMNEETDEILQEQFTCPGCGSCSYSSTYMEKSTSKVQESYSINLNSFGPTKILFCSCGCGKLWIEHATPEHHRPLIRKTTMKSYIPR